MKKIKINESTYLVDERFENFAFHKKPSSNVNVFGHSDPMATEETASFVIQFNNGGTYLYENVDQQDIQGAIDSESIGKYYRAEISAKYTGTKMINPAVILDAKEPIF